MYLRNEFQVNILLSTSRWYLALALNYFCIPTIYNIDGKIYRIKYLRFLWNSSEFWQNQDYCTTLCACFLPVGHKLIHYGNRHRNRDSRKTSFEKIKTYTLADKISGIFDFFLKYVSLIFLETYCNDFCTDENAREYAFKWPGKKSLFIGNFQIFLITFKN